MYEVRQAAVMPCFLTVPILAAAFDIIPLLREERMGSK